MKESSVYVMLMKCMGTKSFLSIAHVFMLEMKALGFSGRLDRQRTTACACMCGLGLCGAPEYLANTTGENPPPHTHTPFFSSLFSFFFFLFLGFCFVLFFCLSEGWFAGVCLLRFVTYRGYLVNLNLNSENPDYHKLCLSLFSLSLNCTHEFIQIWFANTI